MFKPSRRAFTRGAVTLGTGFVAGCRGISGELPPDAGAAADAGASLDGGQPLVLDAGQSALDGGTSLGPFGPWVQLTVAPHLRRVLTIQGNGTVSTFDPTKALAIEAQAPQMVRAIPSRAFSLMVPGEPGTLYYVGGLHSNYQGNEIDRMQLPGDDSTVITTELSHQPNMPAEGKGSGYASGNGGYLYRQYDGGLADNRNWQPYPGHQWTKSGWNPTFGFFSLTPHALQTSYPDGDYIELAGVLQSSAAQPADDYPDMESAYGVVGFDFASHQYKTYLTTAGKEFEDTLLGASGVSDWNEAAQTQLFFHTNAGTTRIKSWHPGTGLTELGQTQRIGGYDGASGNGLLVRLLDERRSLILRQDGNGPFSSRTAVLEYSEDFGTGDARFRPVRLPLEHLSDIVPSQDALSYCVDRANRRVFWLVFAKVGVPLRFYLSHFDELSRWQRITFENDIVIPAKQYFDAYLAGNRQPMLYLDGFLYLVDGSAPGPDDPGYLNGAVNFKRVRAPSP